MVSTTTTGSRIAVLGDFHAGYVIADGIGLTVELVPHLLGSNRRPTGQCGLYASWRTGGKVVVLNALRYLEVTWALSAKHLRASARTAHPAHASGWLLSGSGGRPGFFSPGRPAARAEPRATVGSGLPEVGD
jgi:hypothetical protein